MNTIQEHYQGILNYFERSTIASAESFNAKLKAFRATLRGVKDTRLFRYRVAEIYVLGIFTPSEMSRDPFLSLLYNRLGCY